MAAGLRRRRHRRVALGRTVQAAAVGLVGEESQTLWCSTLRGPLIHTPKLLRVKDAWLTALPEGQLTDVLPVMRRAFGGWAPPEWQALASKVRPLDQIDDPAEEELEVTEVAAVLAAVDSNVRLDP